MGPWLAEGLAPRFYPELAAAKMKHWIAHGVKGIYWCGGGENWGAEGPTYYVLGRMATDPTQDWQEVYEEYLNLTFREAAPAMKQYYDRLYERLAQFRDHKQDSALVGGMNPDDTFGAVYSAQVLVQLKRSLEEAKRLAAGDDRALGWIRLAELHYNHYALIARGFHFYRAHTLNPTAANFAQVRDAVEAYRDWVKETRKIPETDKAFSENFFSILEAQRGNIQYLDRRKPPDQHRAGL